MPYLYSEADIAALMARGPRLRSPLRAATYETLIGLLAVTGMRIGEAIALDRDHVDWAEGVVTVRHSKIGRAREAPASPDHGRALGAYAGVRDELVPTPEGPELLRLRPPARGCTTRTGPSGRATGSAGPASDRDPSGRRARTT